MFGTAKYESVDKQKSTANKVVSIPDVDEDELFLISPSKIQAPKKTFVKIMKKKILKFQAQNKIVFGEAKNVTFSINQPVCRPTTLKSLTMAKYPVQQWENFASFRITICILPLSYSYTYLPWINSKSNAHILRSSECLVMNPNRSQSNNSQRVLIIMQIVVLTLTKVLNYCNGFNIMNSNAFIFRAYEFHSKFKAVFTSQTTLKINLYI